MNPKLIILDLDGPLLEGRFRHYQCYRDILESFGHSPVGIDLYWTMKKDRANRHELLKLSNADHLYDQFLQAWMEKIETPEYLKLDTLQNGVVEILQCWKKDGIKLILATMRNNASNLKEQLSGLAITPLLDDILVVGSDLSGENKSTAVLPFIRQYPLDEILWIGDTEVDVSSAKKLGIKVCALTCGLRSADYLSSLNPDFLMDDLHSFFSSTKI